jgi:hypothetical protein
VNYASESFACSTLLLALFIFLIWTSSLALVPVRPAADRGRTTSYAVLAAFILQPLILTDPSRDPHALLQQGLSLQNVAQVVIGLTGFGWAVWLLLTRAVRPSTLAAGVNFWIGLTIALYAISTMWSLWPSLTMFRTIQLAGFWVLTMHLFSGRPPLPRLTWCLLVVAVSMVMCGAVFGSADYDPSRIFGRLRANQGGVVAGLLTVIVVYRLFILAESRSWSFLLPSSLTTFVLFGSLGSTIALLFAMVTLLIFRLGRHYGPTTQLIILAYILPCLGVFSYALVNGNPDVESWVASVSGKPPEIVANATGRLPLWEEIWKTTRNNVFGFGFGAGERELITEVTSPAALGFTGTNAENGYLAAWLSAGWLAVWMVVFLFVGVIFDATRRSYWDRAYMLPVLVFLGINNLSFHGVGSDFNTAWLVIMVLACAGPITNSIGKREKLRHSYSPVGT